MGRKSVKNMNRKQQKAAFWKMSHIKNKMSTRSPRARSVDRSINAKNVYTGHDTKGKDKWMKHPNQVDMKGIDSKIAIEKYKAKQTKEQLKEKQQNAKKIRRQLHKKREQLAKTEAPKQRKQIKQEIEKKQIEERKIEADVKTVEVSHRKNKMSIHEKQTEKREIMEIMEDTDNNNYMECKALRERAKNKGLAYDNVNWDELQGSDLTYGDRVKRLDGQIGKTYTDEEFYHGHDEEKYQMQYENWLEGEKR